MSNILPVEGVSIASFNLFATYTVEQAEAKGLTVPKYRGDRQTKTWAIPADFPTDGSRGIISSMDEVFFIGCIPGFDAKGNPVLQNGRMESDEGLSFNIRRPQDTLDVLPVSGSRTCPIDLSRWDKANYYLQQDALRGMVVKDRRAVATPAAGGYTAEDRALAEDTNAKVTALLAKFGV